MRSGRASMWCFVAGILAVWLVQGKLPLEAAGREAAERPNVLVIVSDDQRPDTIGALGNPRIATPNLDALAAEGTVMRRAVSPNPICTPSRAEILSGCSGFRNGTFDFGRPINPDLTLWPQAMHDAGYRTWYVGKWHNDGRPVNRGYDQTLGLFTGGGGAWWVDQVDWKGHEITGYRGWVSRNDEGMQLPELGVGLTANISARFADAAIDFIRRDQQQPFFLHVNFTAPHDPLIMPPGYAGRYRAEQMQVPENFLPEHPFDHGNLRGRDEKLMDWPRTPEAVREELAQYYAVISHMDEQIGRILAALRDSGQWDNTIVVFTSDHGLAVGSHGLRGKQSMYEHTVGVPMILRGPGVPSGAERQAQVYLRDLYPTVCELTGTTVPESVEGRSFVPVLKDAERVIHPYAFGYFRDSQRMIRGDRWKLVHYPQVGRYQLFDLQKDPWERNNLAEEPQHAAVRADLLARLEAWQAEVNDPLVAKR